MIQFFLLVLLVFILPDPIKNKIWLGHSNKLIYLALFTSFSMKKIWEFISQIGESMRDTMGIQVRNLVLAVSYLIIVLFMGIYNVIVIERLFVLNAIIYVLFSTLYVIRIYQSGLFSVKIKGEFKQGLQNFKDFCYPLVPYTIFGFVYTFIDYWMLQRFGGSVQQGFYAIAFKFSTIVLIGTASILQVFWKEISDSYSKNDMIRVRLLYESISKSFFFVGIVISSFLVPYSREIIDLVLGPSFKEAWLPFSLMLFYPVHQSLGQITGTMLYAMEKTKAQSYIGIFFMSISIITTYVLLSPKTAVMPGFELGATGLALKMVVCQIIGVNISAFYVAKYISIPFDWFHQFKAFILLPLGIFSKFFSYFIIPPKFIESHQIITMSISGIIYLLCILTLLYFFPQISGINRKQLNVGLSWIRSRF